MKVTNIENFPNGLGFTATINGTRFEIGVDRRLGRLSAWRLRADEMTHFWQTEFSSLVEGAESIAQLIGGMWRDHRGQWSEAT